MELCQKLLSFLPSNNLEDPPQVEGDRNVDADPALDEVVPDGRARRATTCAT